MNWKKILLFGFGAPVVAALNNAIVANQTGQHIPLTAGTVLIPAAVIAVKSLAALFTAPPDQPAPTSANAAGAGR